MKRVTILLFVSLFGWFSTPSCLAALHTPTAILVDKKTNQLHVCEYQDEGYKVLKTYHATLGQVKGDKEAEDDLKTPEGIYLFKSVSTPPLLQKKFGAMGFYMNFPNAFDQLAGRTGSAIMLHATDEPDRLKNNYDSKGCIVVRNEEIFEIKPFIHLGLTPILVFSELTPEYMRFEKDAPLRGFFKTWVESWEKKEIEGYISHYHTDFVANGKNRSQWKVYKNHLNSTYSTIEVNPESILFFRHPKYTMITFTQNYRSRLKSGGWGHRSRGTKILFVAEESGEPKIIAENFSQLMW